VTRARQALGRHGEDRAARWYRQAGYEVLDRNWRCPLGELDLVARRDATLVFCEVKARSSLSFGHPAEAVGPSKQQRIRRLAVQWMDERGVRAPVVRFDVAAVLPRTVEVIEAAF
jgi:putative endonuclease